MPRPRIDSKGDERKTRSIYLTDAEYSKLQKAGNGNASEGVRALLEIWKQRRMKK